jgi:DNA invertase Pin-like site-specific DNA recombinase
MARRAIGLVRVSQANGREGESFASPGEQRDRIVAACMRDGLVLIQTIDELDVSGGKPLEDRSGLRGAVEAVEAGRADVIVAAYFDRLVRSLRVQDELVSRVEKAGGQVLALDVGRVTNGSAGQWLSGTMLGAVAEYARRTAAERSAEAQARAVARGVLPWPNVPPGYTRGDDGVLLPNAHADAVREAFRMRAGGETLQSVREHLLAAGIERSYHGVSSLLGSRVFVGEIHFGELENLAAHEPIVDRELFNRVQRVKVSRGRKAKSDRLLARLGVLRCGSCGSRMVVGTSNNSGYYLYRCPPTGDCRRRVTISAELAERVVVDAVRAALANVEGRASIESNAREAELALSRAQANLDGALLAFEGFDDEGAARERLLALKQERDLARGRVERLGGERATVSINANTDWDRLALDARRQIIRATVQRATVKPGRGAGRVTVELLGE